MRVRIKNGLDLHIGGDPGASIVDRKSSLSSALLGRDYPGVKFQQLVDEGSLVEAGQAVLCDRRRPEIRFTSPVNGLVSAIHRGTRRSLVSFQIDEAKGSGGISFDIPAILDKNTIKDLMLKSGLWPALRTRPYGYIPDPTVSPQALLITAIDTQPLAANPAVILFKYSREFSTGLRLLCDLVDAPVFLCKPVSQNNELENSMRVKEVEFDGPHPAGLVGTHIKTLCPIRFDGNQVWHMGYQDVISLGHLVKNGKPWYERVVSLAGPAVNNPRLTTVPLGARIADIVEGEFVDQPVRVMSGSILSGHAACGYEAFLGRYHNQITAIIDSTDIAPKSWIGGLFETNAEIADPLVPTPELDRVAPPGVLAVPLLRALQVGDVERARDLGALELVEEDLALLGYCCPSRTDYGPLLRDMLNQIDREGLSIRG